MLKSKTWLVMALALFGASFGYACGDDDEDTGDQLDEAADDVGDGIEEAGDEAEDELGAVAGSGE